MDYPAFEKIPRFNRDVVVTEKIDGTNGLISITVNDPWDGLLTAPTQTGGIWANGFYVKAGSRNRWITPEQDNNGFARWVHENAEELTKLGVGNHYGEWYGSGIWRNYGLKEKRFMLFNTARWADDSVRPKCCEVSTVLFEGNMKDLLAPIAMGRENQIDYLLSTLKVQGSRHVPGFMNPEGVIIFHKASRQLFKITLEDDSKPKGENG